MSGLFNFMKRISLTNSNKKVLVDNEDYNLLSRHKWLLSNGYAKMTIKTRIYMHQLILARPKGRYYLDHINHNTLDNRKFNLRIVSASQSNHNRRKNKNGKTSKYIGVSIGKYDTPRKGKWIVQVKDTKNKLCRYGRFSSELEAAKQRDIWAKELFGEYAVLNFTKKV